jgi:NADH-quinone oxidoreductase subunit N
VLFGGALLAGSAGTTSLSGIASAQPTPLLLLGAMLMLGGMAFKLGAAPFHMWVPDTYQGAQAPFVAFLSVAPKAAGVAAMAAVFAGALGEHSARWLPAVAALCVLSLLLGNLLALPQTSTKRLLAYSGIAQIGYVLLGLASGTADAMAMVLFYLAAYVATNVGAFLVVHAVSAHQGSDELEGFEGLARRSPWLSAAMLLLLLSLAGVPFVVGFWAKLYVFAAALKADQVWLVVLGAVLAVVGLFYYLRVVKAMYMAVPKRQDPVAIQPGVALGVGASVAVVVVAGLWPGPWVAAAEQAAGAFFGR